MNISFKGSSSNFFKKLVNSPKIPLIQENKFEDGP